MILVDLFTQAQSLTQMSIGLSGAAVKAELTLVVVDWPLLALSSRVAHVLWL